MTSLVERHGLAISDAELAVVLHLPNGPGTFPCVVACHGLGASKDSEKYLLLGQEFPDAGLALARFDFRGCGESTGREDETTVATRIADAGAVLAFLGDHPRLAGRFGLLGSSMGGFVALHVAVARRDAIPVVTWNAPANLADLGASQDSAAIGTAFLLELASGRYAESPRGVPHHLVIQAEADEVVPVEHGSVLHARAGEPCDFVIIPGADHRLTDMAHRRHAVARSLDWFRRHLKETA